MNFDSESSVPPIWNVGDVVLGTYEVKQVFTGGGMGLVYRVHHHEWGVDLAVKSPRPEYFVRAVQQENFERECETWINLGLHPHIVSCHYVRRLGGIPRIFAEFVEGGSLVEAIRGRQLYAGGEREALRRILDVAIQVAWGLHHAHEQGLVHQDVKPANVLLAHDGTAKITDFGLAKARAESGELRNSGGRSILVSCGGMTPAYCSPEQFAGQPVTRRTDVWSWGLSVLEMFTGEVFWRAGIAGNQALDAYLQSGAHRRGFPKMPDAIAGMLRECFRLNPAERSGDVLALAGDIARIHAELFAGPYPRPQPSEITNVADGLNNRAVSLVDLGKFVEARDCLLTALSSAPDHPQATYNLGLLEWRSAQTSDRDILHRLDQVMQAHSTDWVVPYSQSLIHLERCDPYLAAEKAERAAQLSNSGPALAALERAKGLEKEAVGLIKEFDPIERVVQVGLSDSGCWAISSAEKGTMFLWDLGAARCIRKFEGHQSLVLVVSFDAAKKRMLSAEIGGTIFLWDVASGLAVRAFQGHSHFVHALRLSGDGRFGLSGSWDRTVRLWSMETGQCVRVFEGHTHYVSAVDLSADGRFAVSGGSDGTVRLWDVRSGRCIHVFDAGDEVSAVAFANGDQLILAANYGRTLQTWDCASGRLVRTFHGHTDSVTGFKLAEESRRLLSTSNDGTLRFWNFDNGRCLRTLDAGNSNQIYLSPDGTHAVSARPLPASKLSQICFWDLQSLSRRLPPFRAPYILCRSRSVGEVTDAQRRHQEYVRQAQQALLARDYATALASLRVARSVPGYEKAKDAIDLWHMCGAHAVRTGLRGTWCVRTFGKHTEGIRHVAISRNGDRCASVSHEYCGTMRIWDARTGECPHVFSECHFSDGFIMFPNWRSMIWGGGEKPFGLWDVKSGQCIRRFACDTETVGAHGRSIALSDDGTSLYSDGIEILKRWDVSTGRCVREYVGHTDLVACVAVDRSGRLLVSGGSDNTVRLWDTESGKCMNCLEGHTSTVSEVCVSRCDKWILSGSWDGTIRLWDISTGKCSRVLEGHVSESAVTLTEDNRWAFSAGGIWELASGRRIWSFEGDANLFTTAALSEDNRWAVFGTKGGELQLWELDWEYAFQ